MAIEDSLFPEAPETPAPLFAYRALKGFIFGSPNDEDNENKENAVHLSESRIKKPTSFSTLTPQKRKRAGDYVSSPMKSILRPSGVATPRALHLQKGNVGVTFKDIKKSASPDATPKRTRQDAGMGNPLRTTTSKRNLASAAREQEPVVNALPAPHPLRALHQLSGPEVIHQVPSNILPAPKEAQSTATAGGSVPFDIETYLRTTEKEMKKLVRYGQQMREYARKMDDENAKLKQALDACRKENERLTQAEDTRASGRAVSKTAKRGKQTMHAEWEAMEIPKDVRDGQVAQSSREAEAVAEDRASKQTKESFEIGTKLSRQRIRHEQRDGDDYPEDDNGLREKSIEGRARQSSARLPPDRIAAARERIKLKAARRKASDASEVDWTGL